MKKIVLLLALSLNINLFASRIINATPGKITVRASSGGYSRDFDIEPSKDESFGDIGQLTIKGLSSPVKDMRLIKNYKEDRKGHFVIYLEDPVYLTIDEAKAAGIPIPIDTKQLPIIKPGSGKLAVKSLSKVFYAY